MRELRRRSVERMQSHEGFDAIIEMPDGKTYEVDSVYWSETSGAFVIVASNAPSA
jgi:hypothetical protein